MWKLVEDIFLTSIDIEISPIFSKVKCIICFSESFNEVFSFINIMCIPPGSKETVELGDIAFWPPGSAICLFFGATPISAPGEIRPASPTNIMGKINGDLDKLKSVSGGAELKVKKK